MFMQTFIAMPYTCFMVVFLKLPLFQIISRKLFPTNVTRPICSSQKLSKKEFPFGSKYYASGRTSIYRSRRVKNKNYISPTTYKLSTSFLKQHDYFICTFTIDLIHICMCVYKWQVQIKFVTSDMEGEIRTNPFNQRGRGG